MRRAAWSKLIAVLSLLVGMVVIAAPDAQAGALKDIRCSLYLTSRPSSPGATSSCPTQGFYLAADHYTMWSQLENQSGLAVLGTRDTWNIIGVIPAGNYTRTCSIIQKNDGTYAVGCTLTNAALHRSWGYSGPHFSIPAPGGIYQIVGHFAST